MRQIVFLNIYTLPHEDTPVFPGGSETVGTAPSRGSLRDGCGLGAAAAAAEKLTEVNGERTETCAMIYHG